MRTWSAKAGRCKRATKTATSPHNRTNEGNKLCQHGKKTKDQGILHAKDIIANGQAACGHKTKLQHIVHIGAEHAANVFENLFGKCLPVIGKDFDSHGL